MSLSQESSQEVKNYGCDSYFSLQAMQSGIRLHIGNSVFQQRLEVDAYSNREILTSKCMSESYLKGYHKLNSKQQQYYLQKLTLCPTLNKIINVECNCYMNSRRCKHTAASLLNLLHKRRNGIEINDSNHGTHFQNSNQNIDKSNTIPIQTEYSLLGDNPKTETEKINTENDKNIGSKIDENLHSEVIIASMSSLEYDDDEFLEKYVESLEKENSSPLRKTSTSQASNFLQTPNKKRKRIHPFVYMEVSQTSDDELFYCSQQETPRKKRRNNSPPRSMATLSDSSSLEDVPEIPNHVSHSRIQIKKQRLPRKLKLQSKSSSASRRLFYQKEST